MKTSSLIRKQMLTTLLGILPGLLISFPVCGQFMRTSINIAGTVTTEQIEPLAVTFAKNANKTTASAKTTALFSISGNDDVNVMVRIQYPEFLVSENNLLIPFNMSFAWQNNGSRNIDDARGSNENQASFSLRNNGSTNTQSASNVSNAYLFLDGTADITHANARELSGDITLTIEFE